MQALLCLSLSGTGPNQCGFIVPLRRDWDGTHIGIQLWEQVRSLFITGLHGYKSIVSLVSAWKERPNAYAPSYMVRADSDDQLWKSGERLQKYSIRLP